MSKRITELPAVSSVAGTDLLALAQDDSPDVTRKATVAQMAASSAFASIGVVEIRFGAANTDTGDFLNWGGSSGHTAAAIEANACTLFYRPGTIVAGYVKRLRNEAPSVATGFTVRKGTQSYWDGSANQGNMADTAMVLTVPDSAVEFTDITHTFSVAKGDMVSIRCDNVDVFSAYVVVLLFVPSGA